MKGYERRQTSNEINKIKKEGKWTKLCGECEVIKMKRKKKMRFVWFCFTFR